MKNNGLQFTKTEVALYTKAWNKGLDAHLQPNYGKFHNETTRNKMRKSSSKGVTSKFYKTGNTSWRKQVAIFCKGYHTELMITQSYRCAINGNLITRETSEVDHIIPVYARPDLAFDKTNLQVLSKTIHREKSRKETYESKYTASFSKIKSIEYVGLKETYDIEVDHTDHNYIANGIITHNSQRYADPTSMEFVTREARLQDVKNRQNSIETDDKNLHETWKVIQDVYIKQAKIDYQWAIDKGIAKEVARAILPEGLTTSRLYMAGSLRSWMHYCDLRRSNGTQLEHMKIAEACWTELLTVYPFLGELE